MKTTPASTTASTQVRRRTLPVRVGTLTIGDGAPIAVQSMTTTNTRDIAATAAQSKALAEAGCDLVRITAQTTVEAGALKSVRERLAADGVRVPLVADIHFNPKSALEAAEHVEKVRINPGNFIDSKRFAQREYTDAEYAEEVRRIAEGVRPLAEKCLKLNRAMRIGTNHGSLSDRIMNRYGDTPLGMVESAMEFVRACEAVGFKNFLLSMKASNPVVMLNVNRLLVETLEKHGAPYPLHLGVTEAGEGEDARVKSAMGIGVLLAEGIGDTIRVSLTEDPVEEVPVARALAAWAQSRWQSSKILPPPLNPFAWVRRKSVSALYGMTAIGGEELVKVGLVAGDHPHPRSAGTADAPCEFVLDLGEGTVPPPQDRRAGAGGLSPDGKFHVVQSDELLAAGRETARCLAQSGDERPMILVWDARKFENDDLTFLIEAAVQGGGLLVDGIGDALAIRCRFPARRALTLSYALLQAARVRSTRAEYIACPGCGRTLFELAPTTQAIKKRTHHLKGVKIAIMGCIVNGPGEMADADFGYVGGSPGTVNLYVGKEVVERGVPSAQAPDRLVELIRSHGKWIEP
ncbi:MAG: 4-hydroxy-3-methylbut-2-en-1-yl diphosphate synthase [Candidatus Omnitrophica bacterium CG11_big_fil_rev_8_21_14_0_20_64_10]|nr:MAG: 4-hydroxy-3-methylbut-2-en-1-yl diphosphate synthase [Candidatus Omnitrophica bacterium CG11_big_fil_rev_8_21_14_0_20_64_10]